MLRSTTIACLVTALAVSFVLGQDTPSNPDAVPYKWSTLISIPVVPSGYSEFTAGSIARQLSRPVILQRPGLSQQIRFGIWATTYLPPSTSTLSEKYSRYLYGIGYVMLDFQQMVSESQAAASPSVRIGLGAGFSVYSWNGPDTVINQEWDSGQGIGFLVNGGLRMDWWRLVGELRANLNNGQPKPVITADIGYRTKSLIGASALPVGAVILLIVAVIRLAAAPGLFGSGF